MRSGDAITVEDLKQYKAPEAHGLKELAKNNYGVPEGAPAICHENARNEDAVKSIAGSTVE